jgi:hypothetical protein
VKLVLRVVVGLSTAAAVYAALLFLTLGVGGTECDRGECNFVGELAVDELGRWVLGLAFIGLAVTLGLIAARAVSALTRLTG